MNKSGTVTITTEKYDKLKSYESLFEDNKAILSTFTDGKYEYPNQWFIKDKDQTVKKIIDELNEEILRERKTIYNLRKKINDFNITVPRSTHPNVGNYTRKWYQFWK